MSKTGTTMRANVEPMPERLEAGVETEAYERRIRELAERAVSLATGASAEVRQLVLGIEDPLRLSYLLGSMLDASAAEKQDILRRRPAAQEARAGAHAAGPRGVGARAEGSNTELNEASSRKKKNVLN